MANALSYSLNEPSPLKPMPNATAPAPAPMAASPANALAKTPGPSPYGMPKMQPKNQLLGAAVDGFMRGFAPQQWQQNQDQRKMDGAERAKQTLALMQQQRALPMEQRGQWWQQNAPMISEIIGADVSQMPLDVSKFSDQALDGQIAALSAQMGIAPEKPEFMNLGGGAVGKVQGGKFSMELEPAKEPLKPIEVDGVLVDPVTYEPLYTAPKKVDPADYVETTLADGVYFVNKNDPNDKIKIGAAPKKAGEGPFDPSAPPDPERIRLEREFAKSWDAVRNNYSEIKGQYDRLKAMGSLAASDPASRSAADLALIVSFTKMLDPGSVAREGEVKLTQSAASLYDMVRNLPNQWINGQTTIPDSTRAALLKAADEMMPSYQSAYERLAGDIGATADAYQFPRSRVMMGYRPPEPQQPKPNLMDSFVQGAGNLAQGFTGMFGGGGQGVQQPVRVNSPQERDALPSGTRYVAPDGSVKVKK